MSIEIYFNSRENSLNLFYIEKILYFILYCTSNQFPWQERDRSVNIKALQDKQLLNNGRPSSSLFSCLISFQDWTDRNFPNCQ